MKAGMPLADLVRRMRGTIPLKMEKSQYLMLPLNIHFRLCRVLMCGRLETGLKAVDSTGIAELYP